MDEKNKNFWKASPFMPHWLRPWWILTGITFLALVVISSFPPGGPRDGAGWAVALTAFLAASGLFAGILLVGWRLIRWACDWRHRQRLLFGLASFATLIALFFAEEDWRGWHAWNQYLQARQARGEKTVYTDYIPPEVPAEKNFALLPVFIAEEKLLFLNRPDRAEAWYGRQIYSEVVSNLLPLLPMNCSALVGTNGTYRWPKTPEFSGEWERAELADLTPWQKYYRDLGTTNPAANIAITAQPQTPARDVLLALSKFDPILDELRSAEARVDSRFPVTYHDDNCASILLPHLGLLKRYAQVLQLHAVAVLQDRQPAAAAADVRLSLRLTGAIQSEPFLISQLVRIAMLRLSLQPVYEGLARRQWTAAQLVALDADLAKVDFLAAGVVGQQAEIIFSAREADYLRRHRNLARMFAEMGVGYSGSREWEFFLLRLVPDGWYYQSCLQNSREQERYSTAIDAVARTVSPRLVQEADAATVSAGFLDPLICVKKTFNDDFRSAHNFLKKIAEGQSSVNLARVALALERYRLAHGEFPEALAALAPQFIAVVPNDVIGGGPLKYRRTSDGQFVLYAIGWNEKDDGGVAGTKVNEHGETVPDFATGDWVWRYPAK